MRSNITEIRKLLAECVAGAGDFTLKISIIYGDPIMRVHGYRVHGGKWVIFEQKDMIPFKDFQMATLCAEAGVEKQSQCKQGGLDFHWLMVLNEFADGRGVLAAGKVTRERAEKLRSFNDAVFA